MLTFGYAKDAIASAVFGIVLLGVSQQNVVLKKEYLVLWLITAFVVDLSYTLFPSVHNTPVLHHNMLLKTHGVVIAAVLCGILCLHRKNGSPFETTKHV